jgi:hypothetical protein
VNDILSDADEDKSTINVPGGWEVLEGGRVGRCDRVVQLGWEEGFLIRERPKRKCKFLEMRGFARHAHWVTGGSGCWNV